MSLFSSSLAPASSVVTGAPISSNPFSVSSPSNAQFGDKKRKRPRESDATRSNAPHVETPIKKGNSTGGGGAAKDAYQKRNDIVAAQANLEKLMKKVGMTGTPDLSSPSSTGHTDVNGKPNSNSRPVPTSRRNRHTPKTGESDDHAPGARGAFSDEDAEGMGGDTPVKKRKVKHGLDGRPTGAAAGKSDPLAGLLGGKGKKEKGAANKKQQQPQQPEKKVGLTKTKAQGTPVKASTVGPSTKPEQEEEIMDKPPAEVEDDNDSDEDEAAADEDLSTSAPAQPLTSLQNSLTSKLSSAKFRWLNEQLYTTPSGKAWELMRSEGGRAFDDYHNAHRQQTSAWPSPPLPFIQRTILSQLKSGVLPSGAFIIDLGCGDAELARDLMSSVEGREKGIKVASYDLVGNIDWVDQAKSSSAVVVTPTQESADSTTSKGRGWVVPSDFLSCIPLPGNPGGSDLPTTAPEPVALSKAKKRRNKKAGGSELPPVGPELVDVAVCCLSLMGINWVGGVYEVARVLKEGGLYYVAEVTSRLVDKPGFIALICSFGFELVEHKSPTTHFDLFEFRKTSTFPLGKIKGQEGWLERVKKGEKVMKGCVYKKR